MGTKTIKIALSARTPADFQRSLAIISTLTKQVQIHGLLAGVSFLMLSGSKSMHLPGKRIDFDLESIKKDTPASNPGIWLAFAARDLVFQRLLAIISTLVSLSFLSAVDLPYTFLRSSYTFRACVLIF